MRTFLGTHGLMMALALLACPFLALAQEVSPELVERFNAAAELAREKKFPEALKAYDDMFAPLPGGATATYPQDFLFEARMRHAYTFMDMGNNAAAKTVMTTSEMKDLAKKCQKKRQFDYHFSLGNIHANLRELQPMKENLLLAVAISLRDLQDQEGCTKAWWALLAGYKEAGTWEPLLKACSAASKFGQEHENYLTQFAAMEFACHAFKGLGQVEKARAQALKVRKYYEDAKREDKVAEVDALLKSLPPAP